MKNYSKIEYKDLEPYIQTYIAWEDIEEVLGKRRYKKFLKFMCGQTVPMHGVYPWDVERFFRWEKGNPVIFD
jgi:hypothetical protein